MILKNGCFIISSHLKQTRPEDSFVQHFLVQKLVVIKVSLIYQILVHVEQITVASEGTPRTSEDHLYKI